MEENQPMLIKPSHFQPSAKGFVAERSPMKGSGIAAADTTSETNNNG